MIKLENVTKTFKTGESALSDLNLFIDKGEFVFVTGQSGSGKTTLFRLLIRDYLPTHGSIVVNDWEITKLPNGKVPHLRRRIGVVFQDLKLLMDRTILENVMLPLEMARVDGKSARKTANDILGQVGIGDHALKYPVQLSGGELQRAAIARALIFNPEILIADEPTGNLDITNSWEIVKLLQEINKNGTTVLMATHNTDIVNSLGKRILVLENGRLLRDEHPKSSEHHEKKEHEEHKRHDKK
jgi:cell division transport system ATP-binding protein